jgi:NADP-dependent aldehyde dehydrogenase
MGTTMLTTTNPRTGDTTMTSIGATSDAEVDLIAERGAAAAPQLAARSREWRAGLLESIAAALEERRELLVSTADDETGLGLPRLNGELSRSIFQFRLFAASVREGSYLEATIDHAGDTPLGPGPDIRRMLIPLGPVAVFGASNFPFAFSVAGGDTASALAAGCPVVVKAHGSHPLTSLHSFEAIVAGCEASDAPEGTIGIVFGQPAGSRLVAHPAISAASLTGSAGAAKALLDVINRRDEPIPFYGELSSVNPLVITPGAAAARATPIADGLFASVTGSGGQLCTKPGVALVPVGVAGDALVALVADHVAAAAGSVLLNSRIEEAYNVIGERLIGAGAATMVARASVHDEPGFVVAPTLLSIGADQLTEAATEECFGPLLVIVRYEVTADLLHALHRIPRSLTATIHAEDEEVDLVAELARELQPRVGRLVYNGYPTGVRVSWGQQHGGPWPATNSIHTSVGISAARRFLRPFAWQNAPSLLLPEELRDGPVAVPRRIDGVLTLPLL